MKTLTHIYFVFLILSFLQQKECSKISSNPIYEILVRGNSRSCYSCDGDCLFPEEIDCASTGQCYSKSTRISNNQTVGYKGCLENNFDTYCDANNGEDTSCYVCAGNFCNKDEIPKNDVVDLGTNTCYACPGECSRPTAKINCQENLTQIEGRDVKAACFTFRITREDSVEMYKGCLEDDSTIQATCLYATLFIPEISCQFCRTDLCNGNEEDEEIFPEECYSCDGSCDTPEVHNCKEVLGQETWAKCVAMEYVNEQNQTTVERRCAVVDAAFQANCDLINQQGGNCTICDTNLCNGYQENFVEQCYYCESVCERPLVIHQCEDILGVGAQSKCIAKDYVEDDINYTIRGCTEVDDTVLSSCDQINQQGGNCTICDTNLCNDIEARGKAEAVYFSIVFLLVTVLTINI